MTYLGDQPFKCLRRHFGSLVALLVFLFLFLTLPIVGICLYGDWTRDEPTVISVLGLLACLGVFLFFAHMAFHDLGESFSCRIVPYFESSVFSYPESKQSAFNSGFQLSRYCRQLDDLAITASTPPLSSFGFRDDRDGQKLVWHNASNGVNTVEHLLVALQNQPALEPASEDLKKLLIHLKAAEAKNIRFCLQVRSGSDKMISPMEMEQRKGRFW